MRLLIDLSVCQSEEDQSVMVSLAEAMLDTGCAHDLYVAVDARRMASAEVLRQRFCTQLAPGHFVSCVYPEATASPRRPAAHAAVARALLNLTYQTLLPDVVLYADPFTAGDVVSMPGPDVPACLRVCLLTGPIAPRAPHANEDEHARYDACLSALRTVDLVLTTTAAAREDAIARLAIDPAQIIHIGLPVDASLAWRAIGAALSAQSAPRALAGMRVALVCPRSSAGADGVVLPHALANVVAIDIFTDTEAPVAGCHRQTDLLRRRDDYAAVIYQVANDADCAFMLPLMEQCPGILVLLDDQLDLTFAALAATQNAPQLPVQELLYCDGLRSLLPMPEDRPPALHRRLVELADYLIVSASVADTLVSRSRGGAWLPPMATIPASGADLLAAVYLKAIHAVTASGEQHSIRALARALHIARPDDAMLDTITSCAATNANIRRQPRLLVDVTHLAVTNARSGIQRVVRNIARELGSAATLDRPFELVRLADGKLLRASAVAASIFGLDAAGIPEQEISIQPGDTLLMIDSSWDRYPDFLVIFQAVRQMGGKIVTVVYDLIPILNPTLCVPELRIIFQNWFRLAAAESDLLLCISGAVADEVRTYLGEQGIGRQVAVAHWHLGADIAITAVESPIRPEVSAMVADQHSPLFLMVGTLEPRKGHDFALDAFDQLWQAGSHVRLCIAGSVGWMVGDTLKRIRRHPQLDRQLFFIEQFTDAEIALCYQAASALVAASIAEGFGLPIVEAAIHQVPVIASDIPVFREVGGANTRYFSRVHPQHLADAVQFFLADNANAPIPATSTILTWRQSAAQLLTAIGCAREPVTVATENSDTSTELMLLASR